MKTVDAIKVKEIIVENITCRYFSDCSTCNVSGCDKEKMLIKIEKKIKQEINSMLDELKISAIQEGCSSDYIAGFNGCVGVIDYEIKQIKGRGNEN